MAKRGKTVAKPVAARKAPTMRKRAVSERQCKKENSRLKRELAEALDRQKATSDILNAINTSTIELQPILDTIVKTASRLCDAGIRLIYKLQGRQIPVGRDEQYGDCLRQYAIQHPLSPGRGSLIGRVALGTEDGSFCRIAWLIPNMLRLNINAPENIARLSGCPCDQDGAPCRVIALMRTVVKPFTDKQIELSRPFAKPGLSLPFRTCGCLTKSAHARVTWRSRWSSRRRPSEVLEVISASVGELEPVSRRCWRTRREFAGPNSAPCTLLRGHC